MKTSADIAIVGGGPVGLSLVAMLVVNGVPPNKLVLIDGKSLAQASADPRSVTRPASRPDSARQLRRLLVCPPGAQTPPYVCGADDLTPATRDYA